MNQPSFPPKRLEKLENLRESEFSAKPKRIRHVTPLRIDRKRPDGWQ